MPIPFKSPTSPGALFHYLIKQHRQKLPPKIRKRKKSPVRSMRWLHPDSQSRQYQKLIRDIMALFSTMTITRLIERLPRWIQERKQDSSRADDYSDEFKDLDDELEDLESDLFDEDGGGKKEFNRSSIMSLLIGLAGATLIFNTKQWNKFTDKVSPNIPFNPDEPWRKGVVNAWANENFRLIKSLSADYIKQLNVIVSEGVRKGKTYDEIMREFRAKDWNLTKYKAKFLARDQIGKLNSELSKRRQQDVGVSLYEWSTSRDERVRPTHSPLDGKICTYEDNTVYADTVEDALAGNWSDRSSLGDEGGFEGIPGEDYQCRCEGIPVLDDLIQSVDEEIEEESQG